MGIERVYFGLRLYFYLAESEIELWPPKNENLETNYMSGEAKAKSFKLLFIVELALYYKFS